MNLPICNIVDNSIKSMILDLEYHKLSFDIHNSLSGALFFSLRHVIATQVGRTQLYTVCNQKQFPNL